MSAKVSQGRVGGRQFIQNHPKAATQPTPSGSIVAAQATITDGAAGPVIMPNVRPLVVESVNGNGAVESSGNLEVVEAGTYAFEVRASVLHNYGSSVIFLYALNGGDATEMGRVQVNSNELVLAISRRTATLEAGDVYSFFVSSDFEYADFQWAGAEILAVKVE